MADLPFHGQSESTRNVSGRTSPVPSSALSPLGGLARLAAWPAWHLRPFGGFAGWRIRSLGSFAPLAASLASPLYAPAMAASLALPLYIYNAPATPFLGSTHFGHLLAKSSVEPNML